jgi:tetratricopeptide (TPR) repeat protein
MKRTVLVVFALVVLVAGCKQQQAQWSQGQGGQQVVTPPAAVKNPDEIRQLESLARANPNNKDAWITLGNAQMDSQRYAEAIISYQRALDLDPKNVDVRVDMGTCYRGVGQPERALEEYKRALKFNPRHANAYRNTGVVLANDLHRNAEAAKAFEKYLEIYPGAPDAAQIQVQIQSLKAAK